MDTRVSAPSWLRGRRLWVLGAAFWTAAGLLLFSYRYMDVLTRGRTAPFHEPLIEELTAAWGVGLLLPFVILVTRWASVPRLRWVIHLPALLAFSLLHTTWNWGVRIGSHTLLGLAPYDYGRMPLRYGMELGNHVIVYAMLVSFVLLFDHYSRTRDQEVRLARLEREATESRLQALEARLHPHFLFNALNTVSSVMYDDVRAADTMLRRLSELLRRTLHPDGREITLGDELETLELWLTVMHARFGDRLTVEVDAPPSTHGALLPPLLLQPLLENAVVHGAPSPGVRAHVLLRAERQDGSLVVAVQDNGPGLRVDEATAFERGVGLDTTRRRLETMYGSAGSLELHGSNGGGLRVSVRLPWRESTHD